MGLFFVIQKNKLDHEPNFNFDIDLSYGSLRGDDGFDFSKKNVKSSSKYYFGNNGNSSSGNRIKINSDYGSVTFKKN